MNSRFIQVVSIPHGEDGEPLPENIQSLHLVNVESIVTVDPVIPGVSARHKRLYEDFGARALITLSTGFHVVTRNTVNDVLGKIDVFVPLNRCMNG